MVVTMKVPPTRTAEAASTHKAGCSSGSTVPTAITPCAIAHTLRRDQPCSRCAAKATDSTAAMPKMGQVRPNTSGSDTSCRAIVGRKVAGMM